MESLAENFKLSAYGRQPLSFYSLSFDLVCLFCLCCVFQYKCWLFKFGGAFSYVTPNLRLFWYCISGYIGDSVSF